ncbi:hypothetical protein N184_19150 [Sinorhizobium sp. GL28]|nr:hypothetical protein N184_19150 [Sinorhizobium sp. GL28]
MQKTPVSKTSVPLHVTRIAALEKPRTLYEIGACKQCAHKTSHLFGVSGTIRIKGDEDVSAGRGETSSKRHPFSKARLLYYDDIGHKFARNGDGAVGRVSVDKDDLVYPGGYAWQDMR